MPDTECVTRQMMKTAMRNCQGAAEPPQFMDLINKLLNLLPTFDPRSTAGH